MLQSSGGIRVGGARARASEFGVVTTVMQPPMERARDVTAAISHDPPLLVLSMPAILSVELSVCVDCSIPRGSSTISGSSRSVWTRLMSGEGIETLIGATTSDVRGAQ